MGRHVEALATAVARDGGTAEVLVHGGRPGEWSTAEGVRIQRFRRPLQRLDHAPSAALLAALKDRSSDPDLLHVHGSHMLTALGAARPYISHLAVTPHYYASAPKALRHLAQGRDHWLDRHLLDAADLVVCVSHTEAVDVGRSAPATKIRVIPNGVDAQALAAAQPLPTDGAMILTVDRLTQWSGIHRIISGLPALPPSHRLTVVGRGRRRNALEAHADYLGVSDRVRFVGWVDDVGLHRLLRTASVLVTLKEESLWGGMLLAATCTGTPVVASDLPANREAATLAGRDNIAFVSRRASPFVVADAIFDQALAARHPHPDRVPTWEQIAEQTLEAYKDVLQAKPLRRVA